MKSKGMSMTSSVHLSGFVIVNVSRFGQFPITIFLKPERLNDFKLLSPLISKSEILSTEELISIFSILVCSSLNLPDTPDRFNVCTVVGFSSVPEIIHSSPVNNGHWETFIIVEPVFVTEEMLSFWRLLNLSQVP